jgi:hypothetical protein
MFTPEAAGVPICQKNQLITKAVFMKGDALICCVEIHLFPLEKNIHL